MWSRRALRTFATATCPAAGVVGGLPVACESIETLNPGQRGKLKANRVAEDKKRQRAQMYEDLWRNTALRASQWPQAAAMREKLIVSDAKTGRLAPPRFGSGVVGSAVFHDQTQEGKQLFLNAREVMEAFLNDLASHALGGDASRIATWQEQGVWWCPEEAFHTIVTIFMETKEILDNAEEKQKCREVSIEDEHQLAEALLVGLAKSTELKLQVRGYRITPDGALLVLFEEPHGEGNSFTALRQTVAHIGTNVLGELTSRPKNIIHATVGRVMLLPADLSDAERAAAADVVRRWSQALGAGHWPGKPGQSLPGLYKTLPVTQIYLYRETVWWLTECSKVEIPLLPQWAT